MLAEFVNTEFGPTYLCRNRGASESQKLHCFPKCSGHRPNNVRCSGETFIRIRLNSPHPWSYYCFMEILREGTIPVLSLGDVIDIADAMREDRRFMSSKVEWVQGDHIATPGNHFFTFGRDAKGWSCDFNGKDGLHVVMISIFEFKGNDKLELTGRLFSQAFDVTCGLKIKYCDTTGQTAARFTSQFRGVGLSKKDNRFHVRLRDGYSLIQVGRFSNELDAAFAYDKVAREKGLSAPNFLEMTEDEMARLRKSFMEHGGKITDEFKGFLNKARCKYRKLGEPGAAKRIRIIPRKNDQLITS